METAKVGDKVRTFILGEVDLAVVQVSPDGTVATVEWQESDGTVRSLPFRVSALQLAGAK